MAELPKDATFGMLGHLLLRGVSNMKKNTVSKCSLPLVVLIILTGLLSVMPSCGGGGGGGSGPAPVSPPNTTASPVKGIYAAAQSVTLTANKSATIYYSLDGMMPSIGGANTFSGPSPISNIQVANDTNLLQFFAVDSSGLQEAIKSETYVIINGAASGPGDPLNYFPIVQGNIWRTQVTVAETGYPTVTYSNTISITGTKLINGATAVIWRESNPENTGIATEDYNLKSSNGLLVLGVDDPMDLLVPYYFYTFPTKTGSTFVAISKAGLDYGEDLDWDGKNESMDINAVITMKGFESVAVPAALFDNCAKYELKMDLTVTLSDYNEQVKLTIIQTEWEAPGVGAVKYIAVTTGDDYSSTETEVLTGYYVDGHAHGDMLQPVNTTDASGISDTSATLRGSFVAPYNWGKTTYWFEYGTTTAYGYTTAPRDSYNQQDSVSWSITNLLPLTAYHYRIVVQDSFSMTYFGDDRIFTTLITPEVLASGLYYPTGIAIDSVSVYWIEDGGRTVKKTGLNGGPTTTLSSTTAGANHGFNIVVDPLSVYWTSMSTIEKVGINGGSATILASVGGLPNAIAVDSTSVYWAEGWYGSGAVKKTGINGGQIVTLATDTYSYPSSMAIDATSVYWIEGPSIKKTAKNGGTAEILAPKTHESGGLAVDASSVYWSDGYYGTGAIKKVSKDGGAVTILASELPEIPADITVDSESVYWTGSSYTGTVKKVGINGGLVTTLAAGLSNPCDIAVDSSSVYWTENNYQQGTVKKVPKSY
jgi:hypothetical protein